MCKAEKYALLAVELLDNGEEHPFQSWGAFRTAAKKAASRFEVLKGQGLRGLRFEFDDESSFAFWRAGGCSFVALDGKTIFKSNPGD